MLAKEALKRGTIKFFHYIDGAVALSYYGTTMSYKKNVLGSSARSTFDPRGM
jgi:hypothetical protein